MTHAVKTFGDTGKLIYEESFETAEQAYEFYLETIDNLSTRLPVGHSVTVARFKNEKVMTMEVIDGTAN